MNAAAPAGSNACHTVQMQLARVCPYVKNPLPAQTQGPGLSCCDRMLRQSLWSAHSEQTALLSLLACASGSRLGTVRLRDMQGVTADMTIRPAIAQRLLQHRGYDVPRGLNHQGLGAALLQGSTTAVLVA